MFLLSWTKVQYDLFSMPVVRCASSQQIISKLSPWDHLPGILIAREAGGIDTYFDDGQYNFLSHKKNLIVSGNKVLTDKIFNLIIGG